MPLAESARKAPVTDPVRLALDCLPDPSLVIDGRDAVVHANTAYERMSGFSLAEVAGLGLAELTAPGGPAGFALFRHKLGGLVPVQADVREMAGELASHYRLVRLDQAETRRTLVEELSAGLEGKSEFLTRVSHELRTPLTAMQEGIDVVLDGLTGPLNEQQLEFLQLARRNVQRLSRLVKDTLEVGDLKRGESPVAFRVTDLESLLRQTVASYPEADYAPGEPVWVTADETHIRDVVERLVQNAIRHSHSHVSVGLKTEDGSAVVAVADSGPGIPADKLETIFDEFEQLSTGPGRTVGGVGLGLAIVKLTVEQHGGRVWVESEPGRGACFYFSLKTCSPPVEKHDDNRDPR